MTTSTRLEAARTHLASITKQVEAIEARDANRHWTELDMATVSGIRRKPNRRADERRFTRYSREAALFQSKADAEVAVRVLESQLARETFNATRERFNATDLENAAAVKNEHGWHRVARVNKVSVSVETGYSWVDKIPFDKVLGAVCVWPHA